MNANPCMHEGLFVWFIQHARTRVSACVEGQVQFKKEANESKEIIRPLDSMYQSKRRNADAKRVPVHLLQAVLQQPAGLARDEAHLGGVRLLLFWG